jgi:uncharacterized protein (DUF362 family)
VGQKVPKVAIIRGSYDDLNAVFSRVFSSIGTDLIDDANQIGIKINLCDYKPPETGATTHPKFLDGFLDWVKSRNNHANIHVVESDATVGRPDLISKWLGIEDVIKKHGATWVNLSKGTWSRRTMHGIRFRSMKIPDVITRSDVLISMAKLKTHTLTTISCSLKNQFGCIMQSKKTRFHDFLDEAIVDACSTMTPDLAIVDGVIGMGGPKGPVDGVPVHAGLVIAGRDPVAVDAACAKIMGLDPHRIKHLKMAEEAGLGSIEFEACGEGIPTSLPNFEINETYRRILKFAVTLRGGVET